MWAFNGRSKDISVIDTASRKVVATIAVPGKPEFAAADGKGNVYNNIEDKSLVLKLDAHDKKITATWPAGCESPSGLAMDIAGNRLFPVCDGNKMSVIDASSGKILATPAIGDGPDAAGWSAQHNLAFASSAMACFQSSTAPRTRPSNRCQQRRQRAPWPTIHPPIAYIS